MDKKLIALILVMALGIGIAVAETFDNITVTNNTNVQKIQFNTSLSAIPHSEALVYYDNEDRALTVYVDILGVSLQIGQEDWLRVKNGEGSNISDGQAVYISGSIGVAFPKVKLARSDNSSTAAVVGVATHDIPTDGAGIVTTFGMVKDINTSMFSAGDILYLSDTEFGKLTTVAPTQPSFPIQIGVVIVSHHTEGKIFVNVGPTDVTGTMVIDNLFINNNLGVTGDIDVPNTTSEIRLGPSYELREYLHASGHHGIESTEESTTEWFVLDGDGIDDNGNEIALPNRPGGAIYIGYSDPPKGSIWMGDYTFRFHLEGKKLEIGEYGNAKITLFSNGVIYTKNYIIVGHPTDPKGITMYDTIGGSGHCLIVENDALKLLNRSCS